MTNEVCFWVFCFVPQASSPVPKIFGFAEFVSSLALLVIVYTVTDIRYRFRIAITPLPLYRLTFILIAVIGVESLLTEIWMAEGWWVPKVVFLTRVIWQTLFAILFLTLFMSWMYYAFISPPIFNPSNSSRYAQTLYQIIVKGSSNELPVIADELGRSAKSLVTWSCERASAGSDSPAANKRRAVQKPTTADFAYDILRLVANRKLCSHIIGSSHSTAIAFFDATSQLEKRGVPLEGFAKSISTEAIENEDSLLYNESDEYSAGLLGRIQPFSNAIYGDINLIEILGQNFGSPLDVTHTRYFEWNSNQWRIYCHVTLVTIRAHVESDRSRGHSFPISRALGTIKYATAETYKLNENDTALFESEPFQKLTVVTEFLKDVVDLIGKQPARMPATQLRSRAAHGGMHDLYDELAEMMFDVIFSASHVTAPPSTAWMIHYNTVWDAFFNWATPNAAWKIVRFKLRRLLYEEIVSIERWPNFKNTRILGFCLNIFGFPEKFTKNRREALALMRAVLSWTARNYLQLWLTKPEMAKECLIGSVTFDEVTQRLAKTYLSMPDEPPNRQYLELRGAQLQPVRSQMRKLLRARPGIDRRVLLDKRN